jgi:hypothetical protein
MKSGFCRLGVIVQVMLMMLPRLTIMSGLGTMVTLGTEEEEKNKTEWLHIMLVSTCK